MAVVVLDGVAPFELGILCEAWGIDRSAQGCPVFDFALCAPDPGPVRTSLGFDVSVAHGLERLEDADLIALPATPRDRRPSEDVVDALRRAYDRGAQLLSVCSGAFVLGYAGLLDGRRCTTHWMYADELDAQFPDARVDCDVLYVDEGQVITSAGSAAGVDACLHLVRREFGAKVAAAFARRMVVPPQRDGGQAQYVRSPIGETVAETLEPVLDWATGRLDQPLSVDVLARRAHMSGRTFARRFRDETGTTPHQWLTQQRLARAEELLEDTALSIEDVARRSGFGNAATLRHHFGRVRNTTPQAYRRAFGTASA